MSETMIVGIRAVEALLAHRADRVQNIAVVDRSGPRARLVQVAEGLGVQVEVVPRVKLDKRADGLRHQGVIATATPADHVEWASLLGPPNALVVAVDELTDPRNLGSILRSAEAMGATGALITKHRCAQLSPTVTRTSAGASELIPIARETNLDAALAEAQAAGLVVVGADLDGVAPHTIDLTGPTLLVIGAEGKGLRRLTRKRCDFVATIPLVGQTESLNAANAASILLYEAARQRALIAPQSTGSPALGDHED